MNQKGFANIAIVVLIIVVGAVVGYFYWTQKTATPVEQAQKTNVLPSQQTTDWKTYRSERYGYVIQYPKDWHIDDSDADDEREEIIFADLQRGIYGVTVYDTKDKNNPVFVAQYLNGDFPKGCVEGSDLPSLNSFTIRKMSCTDQYNKSSISEVYILKRNDILFELSFSRKADDMETNHLFYDAVKYFHFE